MRTLGAVYVCVCVCVHGSQERYILPSPRPLSCRDFEISSSSSPSIFSLGIRSQGSRNKPHAQTESTLSTLPPVRPSHYLPRYKKKHTTARACTLDPFVFYIHHQNFFTPSLHFTSPSLLHFTSLHFTSLHPHNKLQPPNNHASLVQSRDLDDRRRPCRCGDGNNAQQLHGADVAPDGSRSRRVPQPSAAPARAQDVVAAVPCTAADTRLRDPLAILLLHLQEQRWSQERQQQQQ